jgi:hypothetical protein
MANGQRVVLPSDLTQQAESAYQIGSLAETQKLSLEAVSGDGQIRKYHIIKTVDQLPQDKPLSFSDYPLVGNIKNALKNHGYTLVLS